jgi:hypothetical protein
VLVAAPISLSSGFAAGSAKNFSVITSIREIISENYEETTKIGKIAVDIDFSLCEQFMLKAGQSS